ncbi:MAG: hypothetical protein CFE46_03935 [Burkholderiales bacterium PBB6]|nr:MAG: hypothetical protein CFE46_03935 [Burkholderiales bacterium PBB6]
MNVSSNASTSQLWSLLSKKAASSLGKGSASSASTSGSYAAASSTAKTATTNATTNASTADTDPSTSTTGSARRGGHHGPPPSSFSSDLSTAQFAGLQQMGGGRPMGPPPGDPVASLDSDDSGSVSADEFGLKDASSDVQALFKAIDGDGSGDLSNDEINQFREQFRQDMAAAEAQTPTTTQSPTKTQGRERGHGQGDGPPPEPPESGGIDVNAFLNQLASRYADMMGGADVSATASFSVSVTA